MDKLINLSTTTLAASPSGKVSGGIWLRLGDLDFPERGWNDYPVVLLAWWLEAMDKLQSGSVTKAECNFMDGPWHFEVEPAGGNWRLRLLDGHKKGSATLVGEGMVVPAELVKQTLAAAREVVAECRRHSWKPADLPALEKELERSAARLKAKGSNR